MGLDLLPHIEGRDNLLLVDAVDFGEPPGTVRTIEGPDIKAFLDMKFSVHQIGVPDMLFAAAFKGISPARICLAGIQPGVIETGLDMSLPVREGLPKLIDVIIRILASWGVEAEEKADVPGNTV